MDQVYTTRTTCRVCREKEPVPLFSLGEQYVSNFVTREEVQTGQTCPIDLELCLTCGLVQQKHTAPQELLYARYYWYRSGVTSSMRAALKDIVDSALTICPLEIGDIALDIGSNDGTLLRNYPSKVVTIGVEPAKNLHEEGRKGITELIEDFWSADTYFSSLTQMDPHGFVGPKAKIVTAIGMFYDLEDPNQFIEDIAKVLHPEGVFIAQLMCLRNMLLMGDVGNLAHEHLEFYSLKCLEFLLGRYGLEIFDVEINKVNGSSYRLYCGHKGKYPKTGRYRYHIRQENIAVLESPLTYINFYNRIDANRRACVEFLQQAKKNGKRTWVYGASTKGNVMLQWYGLDTSLIEGAAERSPEKYGKYTVGTGIPIVSEEEARKTDPDYFLVLPYTFLGEFIERELAWRKGTGRRWLVPLPQFKVI